jgi:hypothetical protein
MEAARNGKDGQPVPVLRKGDRVVVIQGPHENTFARVIDPVPVPDGPKGQPRPNQRKVLVLTENEDFELYILPRQIELAEVQHPITTTHQPTEAPVMQAAIVDSADVQQSADRPIVHFEHFTQQEEITDPMDPALDQFRPDPSLADSYISRKLPGGYTDVEFMLHMRDQRDEMNGYSPNVAMVGPTQAGKTHFVSVLAIEAAKRDGLPKPYPVFTLNGSSGISNYDLYGKTTAVIIDGQEVLVWMNGVVPLALHCGGILYLDEWNAVPPTQAVALHPVLDDRRQFTNTHRAVPDGRGNFMPEVVVANKNLWTISTINPLGYKGTQAMAEATSNRFRWYEWGYNTEVEVELVPSDQVRDLGTMIRDNPAIKTPVGTSALMRFNDDLATFGYETAMWSFLAMFQTEKDRLAVEELIQLNNFQTRLDGEYKTRDITPA